MVCAIYLNFIGGSSFGNAATVKCVSHILIYTFFDILDGVNTIQILFLITKTYLDYENLY